MKIGLAFDLKTSVAENAGVEDALEEYDSPETVDILENTFISAGHQVVRLGGGEAFLDAVRREKVDLVFNICEGRGNFRSREAQVPAVLEMLGIPYSGSDPVTLGICLDKPLTKKLVAAEGIATPRWFVLENIDDVHKARWDRFPFPVILKPSSEGSSKGIRLTSLAHNVREAENEAVRILGDYRQPVMVEEYIEGEELTVGVVGNGSPEVTGMMRVVPRKKDPHFIYSLEVKRDYLNLVDYESPVKLPEPVLEKLQKSSLAAFRTLGCRDVARVDFRVDRHGVPYFIEVNPLPGLGTYSDLIIMAGLLGRTHRSVILSVLDAAMKRYSPCSPS